VSSDLVRGDLRSPRTPSLDKTQNVTGDNKPIHNILSNALQLRISRKALGTFPEEGNVMPKHVGATIHN
jgi:hypothetical protein